MHGRRRFAPIVLLVVVAIAATAWYLAQPQAQAGGALSASGSIEATTVTISPEVAGRVTAVNAAKGDDVAQGDVIVTLDGSLLEAQRAQAEAAVAVAAANVKGADANVAAAAADATRAEAAVGAAEAAKTTASSAVDGARATLKLARAGASSAQLAVARSQVNQAQAAYRGARDAYAALSSAERKTPAGRTAKATRDTAKAAIATARAQYNLLAAGSRSQQVDGAKAAVDAARAQVTAASRQVDAAAAQGDAAKARVDGARAAADAARAQQQAAIAGLAVIDAQASRLTMTAPVSGTVMTRSIEPGEVVSPGASLMELADLGHLTVTVFVPEDRYGEVSLGQPVTVTVDSFPGETFTGKVSRIADQAEFTPRNVQTVEGRKSTVFAIELALDDTGGKLKPGMPADVTFR
jgi:HlyD family secretion protein